MSSGLTHSFTQPLTAFYVKLVTWKQPQEDTEAAPLSSDTGRSPHRATGGSQMETGPALSKQEKRVGEDFLCVKEGNQVVISFGDGVRTRMS